MNLKIKEFTKHYEAILIIIAVIVTFVVGRTSKSVININSQPANTNVPLTYNDISTATNEKGEIVILKRQSAGYKVLFVLSDTVAKGISNININQRYQDKL